MADREKVISNFEHEVNKAHGEGWDFVDLSTDDAEEILTLLKERESAKGVKAMHYGLVFWTCNACGMIITEGDKFCRGCGRGLKWK